MKFTNMKSALIGTGTAFGASALSFAQDLERVGKPIPGGKWFPPAVGEVAQQSQALNVALIWLSFIISLFVVALLVIVVFRFRDTGKEPRRFSHNTPLEIAWTLIPVLVLVVLAIFSVPALRKQVYHPEADIVVKVTGYQWYWSYEYPEEQIAFDSIILQKEELAEHGYQEDEYLLAVDNAMVVPVGKNILVETQAGDVIHSWKVPSLYVMTDANPGRTLTTWFNADREGVFFGQCSELCGKDHAYMPIVVKVVSEGEYAAWLETAREEFATGPSSLEVASNK